jgi:hypothetical protein
MVGGADKVPHLELDKWFSFQAIPGTRTRLCCSSCQAPGGKVPLKISLLLAATLSFGMN